MLYLGGGGWEEGRLLHKKETKLYFLLFFISELTRRFNIICWAIYFRVSPKREGRREGGVEELGKIAPVVYRGCVLILYLKKGIHAWLSS